MGIRRFQHTATTNTNLIQKHPWLQRQECLTGRTKQPGASQASTNNPKKYNYPPQKQLTSKEAMQ